MAFIKSHIVKRVSLRRLALFILAALVLARVFAIMSERVVPDADECIVGLMGMHVLEGKGHPLYFYGQGYGAGAGLEAHAAALIFSFSGVDGKALKLVALLVWIVLALAGWGLAQSMLGRNAGAVGAILLMVTPQMAQWSMKLRGGHLPALVFLLLAAWSTWSLSEDRKNGSRAVMLYAFGCGFLAALSAWMQPIAAPAALAMVFMGLVFLLLRKRYVEVIPALTGALIVAVPAWLTLPAETAWTSPLAGISHASSNLAPLALKILPRSFTPYQDPVAFELSLPVLLAAIVWGALVLMAFVLALRRIFKERRKDRLSGALVLTTLPVLFCLVAALFVDPTALAPRHVLAGCPFFCLLAASVLCMAKTSRLIKTAAVFYALLFIAGITANTRVLLDTSFHNPGLGVKMPASSVSRTVNWLEARGFSRVYSADTDFTWNLIFASRERIIARSWPRQERYQSYVEEVDRAARSGARMAVVVPYPEGPLKKPVVKKLMDLPGARFTMVAPRVAVITGIPGGSLMKIFPPAK